MLAIFKKVNAQLQQHLSIVAVSFGQIKVSFFLYFSLQIWVLALSVCFAFTITIGTFPAVTVDVKSTIADGGAWGESGIH